MKDLLFFNIIILLSGSIATVYTSSRKYLESRGFTEEYIVARKSFGKRGVLIQLATYIITQFILIVIFRNIGLELDSDNIVKFYLPGIFLVLIPVTIYISSRFNKELKKLANKTGEDIVVDFGYTLLYKFFNLKIEIPVTILVLFLAFLSFKEHGFSTLLYSMLIPWMMFLVNRFAKYMNVASYKESYRNMLIFGNFYGVFLPIICGFNIWLNIVDEIESPVIPGIIATVLLLGKLVLLRINTPYLRKELDNITKSEEK